MDTINLLTFSFQILKFGKLGTNGKERKTNLTESIFFSVIDYYHEPNKWLFGGIWEVKKRHLEKSREDGGYEIELVPEYQNLIGRLVLKYQRSSGRGRAFLLEKWFKLLSSFSY